MSSGLLFVDNFVEVKNDMVGLSINPTIISESLLEKVRQLLLEIRIMRAELAQAENNLALTSSVLCEALYQDMESRKSAKVKDLSMDTPYLKEDVPMVACATIGFNL